MKDSAVRVPKPTSEQSGQRLELARSESSLLRRDYSLFSFGDSFIQRKPGCSCGGTCPDCKKKKKLDELVQTKLTIGKADDRYEREADLMADVVMGMSEARSNNIKKSGVPTIQKSTQGGCSVSESNVDLAGSLARTRNSGSPLPPETRMFMESRFRADFSKVRVHNYTASYAMSRELGAQAFTHRYNIYFNRGYYDPQGFRGRHLLAHELTHVLQQTGVGVSRSSTSSGSPEIQTKRREGVIQRIVRTFTENASKNVITEAPIPGSKCRRWPDVYTVWVC